MKSCTPWLKSLKSNLKSSSLVPQTLWSQGAYRLEIISARSKRVWCNAYTFFVQRIAESRTCWLVFTSFTRGVNREIHHWDHVGELRLLLTPWDRREVSMEQSSNSCCLCCFSVESTKGKDNQWNLKKCMVHQNLNDVFPDRHLL